MPPNRPGTPRFGTLALAVCLARLVWAVAPVAAQDEPPAAVQPAPPPTPGPPAVDPSSSIYILRQGEDLSALLRRLGNPDFVLLPGGAGPPSEPRAAVPPTPARSAGVTSIDLRARIEPAREVARVTVALGISTRGQGPHLVPIDLQGLYPRDARDVATGAELGWIADEDGRWQLRVPGQGGSTVEIELETPIQLDDDRRRISLRLPESASTHVLLDLPYTVESATTTGGTPLVATERPAEPVDGLPPGSRIEANLSPRSLIELTWRPRPEGTVASAPLVTAQGDHELTVGGRVLTARSNWVVLARRGEIRSIRMRLDADDELVGVESGGRSLVARPVVAQADADVKEFDIQLAAPLSKGETVNLVVNARRTRDAASSSDWVFHGHTFLGLADQSGFLTVAAAEGLRLRVDPKSGLRRIDVRQLSDVVLGSRPSVSRAYQFNGQPFELSIRAETFRPRLLASIHTAVRLDGPSTALTAWLDHRVSEGRPLEVRVLVPPGLEIVEVGPRARVDGWELLPGDSAEAPRVLEIALGSEARDSADFRLVIAARTVPGESVDGPEEAGREIRSIPLLAPESGALVSGRVSIWSGPASRISLPSDSTPDVRKIDSPAGIDVERPLPTGTGTAPGSRPSLELEYGAPITALRVETERLERRITQSIRLKARVTRDAVEVTQQLDAYVHDGTLSELDLLIPPELEGRWKPARTAEIAGQEPLGLQPDGTSLVRVRLLRPVSDNVVSLEFSYPLAIPKTDGLPVRWIRAGGTSDSGPVHLDVGADPGINLRTDGDGWLHSDPAAGPSVNGPSWTWIGTDRSGPGRGSWPSIRVEVPALAELPDVVVSRLWLLSNQAPDGSMETAAWFRVESHDDAFDFRLPAGSSLERAYVNGSIAAPVERVAGTPDAYRLSLTDAAESVAVVGVSYRVPAGAAVDAEPWQPPTLLGGGRIQQTFWEVRVPWNRAVVGRPQGWTDENRWYWGGYVWKRRPWKNAADLSAWVGGPFAPGRQLAPLPPALGLGEHGYLFGRTGELGPMGARVSSRAALVALCSGGLLALGLAWLAWRPLPRGSGVVLSALALLAAVFLEPSTLFVVVQSSAVGAVLLGLAATMQRTVDGRRAARTPPGDRTGHGSSYPGPVSGEASGQAGPAPRSGFASDAPGSDDSTAIRARPAAVSPPPGDPDAEVGPAVPPPAVASTRSHRTRAGPNEADGEVLEIPFTLGQGDSPAGRDSHALSGGDVHSPRE